MRLRIPHRADYREPISRFFNIQVTEQNVEGHGIDLDERVPNSCCCCHIKTTSREKGSKGEPNAFFILNEQKTYWLRFGHSYFLVPLTDMLGFDGSTEDKLDTPHAQSDVCPTPIGHTVQDSLYYEDKVVRIERGWNTGPAQAIVPTKPARSTTAALAEIKLT